MEDLATKFKAREAERAALESVHVMDMGMDEFWALSDEKKDALRNLYGSMRGLEGDLNRVIYRIGNAIAMRAFDNEAMGHSEVAIRYGRAAKLAGADASTIVADLIAEGKVKEVGFRGKKMLLTPVKVRAIEESAGKVAAEKGIEFIAELNSRYERLLENSRMASIRGKN